MLVNIVFTFGGWPEGAMIRHTLMVGGLVAALAPPALAQTPPHDVRAGATNLIPDLGYGRYGRYGEYGRKAPLSQAVNDCRKPDPPAPGKPAPLAVSVDPVKSFRCIGEVARLAAFDYERKSHERQRWSDAGTFLAGAGLTGVLLGTGHASATTLRYWTFAGAAPIATDDLTQFSPRARLYVMSSTAMNTLANYYEELNAALGQDLVPAPVSNSGGALNIVETCGEVDAIRQKVSGLSKIEQAAMAAQVALLRERCVKLISTDAVLVSAELGWQEQDLSGHFATDVKQLNARVTDLDRGFRSRPSEALGAILASPFELVGQILKGEKKPTDYTNEGPKLLDQPLQASLVRLPAMTLPEPVSPELAVLGGPQAVLDEATSAVAQAAALQEKATTKSEKVAAANAARVAKERVSTAMELQHAVEKATDDLNRLTAWTNLRFQRLSRIKAVADNSKLVLDFNGQERAAQMTTP